MKNIKSLLFVTVLLFAGSLYAQPPAFEEEVNDVEAAPIPGILYAVVAGVAIGCGTLYKKSK